jgi:hypothetical protein
MTTVSTTAAPVTELSGSLSSLNLPAILRFLSDLQKSGMLSVSFQRWQGTVALQRGALIGASLGSESGAAAFEGMAVALPEGKFVFREDAPVPTPGAWHVEAGEVAGYLQRLETERAQTLELLPRLGLVPMLAAACSASTRSETVTIDGDALGLLPHLSRRCTVEQLAAERGLARTVRHVARLAELGLISLESPAPPRVAAPAPPAKRGSRLGGVARPLVGFFVRGPEPSTLEPTSVVTAQPATSPRLVRSVS